MLIRLNHCNVEIELYKTYEKIRRDYTPYRGCDFIELYTARGEAESFQLRIRADKDVILEEASFWGNEGTLCGEFFVQYFHKTTFQSTKFYAKGEYPDALFPLKEGKRLKLTKCEAGKNFVLLCRVKALENCETGKYECGIVLTFAGGEKVELICKVEVNSLVLPKENHSRTAFGIWKEMLKDVEEDFSDEVFAKYYDKLAEYRVSPTQLPYIASGREGNEAFLTLAKEKAVDARISTYSIPFESIVKQTEDGKEYKDLDDEKLRSLLKEMVRESSAEVDLFKKAVLYISIIDEPGVNWFFLVKRICDAVEEMKKQLSDSEDFSGKENVKDSLLRLYNIVTVFQYPELYGHVRCFCPLFSIYSMPEYVREAKRLQQEGTHIWWYGCIAPMHPHPNYHIDDNLQNIRAVSYLQKKYGIEGNLYWGVNVHKFYDGTQNKYIVTDIYENPVAYPACNGDGFLVYPMKKFGLSQPLASLRLEMIRKANEDYEYLWLLEWEFVRLKSLYGFAAEFSEYLAGIYDQIAFRTVVREEYIDFDKIKRELCSLIEIAVRYNAVFLIGERDAEDDSVCLTVYCDKETDCPSWFSEERKNYRVYTTRTKTNGRYSAVLKKEGRDMKIERTGHLPYRSLFIGELKMQMKADFDNAADEAVYGFSCQADLSNAENLVFEVENTGMYAKTVTVVLVDEKGNRFPMGYDVAESGRRKTFRLRFEPRFVTEAGNYDSTAFCNSVAECTDIYKCFDFSKIRQVTFSLKNISDWPYGQNEKKTEAVALSVYSFGYEEK